MAEINFGGLNMGPTVGRIVANAPPSEDRTAREVLGPDTEAGQALLVMFIGLALVYVAVGPGDGGPLARLGRALQSIALVAAAMAVVGFTARTYTLRHPDGPLAAGITHDL